MWFLNLAAKVRICGDYAQNFFINRVLKQDDVLSTIFLTSVWKKLLGT